MTELPPPYTLSTDSNGGLPAYSSTQQPYDRRTDPTDTLVPMTLINPLNPSNSRILIKTVAALPITHGCILGSFAFGLEIPEWYVSLDTVAPGWEQGIIECNQTLRILYFRKGWISLYRGLAIGILIAGIFIFMFNIGKTTQNVILGILFPVDIIMFLCSNLVNRFIFGYGAPLVKLRSKVTDMGWSLSGFEESFMHKDTVPEIVVSRYTRP